MTGNEAVDGVSTFIGQGPPRFYLPVSPEDANSAYAQLVVNTKTLGDVDKLIAHLDPWMRENVPEAMVRVRKYAVGAFDDWKFEARFSGPANADPDTLRRLAEEGMEILRASPYAKEVRTNWRQRTRKLVPRYNQERGRWAGVSRDDLAQATKRASDGVAVGQYRQEDDLIPIVLRNNDGGTPHGGLDPRKRADRALVLVQHRARLASRRRHRHRVGRPDHLALGPPQGDHRAVLAQRRDRADAAARACCRRSRPSRFRRATRWNGTASTRAPRNRRSTSCPASCRRW